MSAAGRSQLWLYGLEAVLQPAPVRPSQPAFSLPAVLARLEAHETPLSEGAETLRAALTSAGAAGERGPPTMAALAAAFAGRCQIPAETSVGGVQKLKCATARTGGESANGGQEGTIASSLRLEAALEQCVARIEERLWQKINPRLESIDRKQDLILDRLDKLGSTSGDGREKSPH